MQQATLTQTLRHASERAQTHLTWLQETQYPDCEALYQHIRAYTLAKFLLPPQTLEDDLIALAKDSIARMMGIDISLVSQQDQPGGCTASTAVLDKKTLLIMRVCGALEIKLPPMEVPKLKTLRQLTNALYNARLEKTP